MEHLTTILKDLANQLVSPFRTWLEGLDQKTFFLPMLFVLLVLVFRKPLAAAAVQFSTFIGEKIGLTISKDVQDTINPAVQTLIVSLALLIGLEASQLPKIIDGTLEKILLSVVVISIFAAFYRLTDVFAAPLSRYRSSQTAIQLDWLVMLGKIVVGVLGVAAVLKIWAINIGPALTGMGVLSAGVALAAQDLLKNLIAGFTNMSEKRFQAGDWIRVDGVIEGVVEKMEFRSALIRRFDMAPVYVPNAELANSLLINYSRMPHRKIRWKIAVPYSTTTKQLAQIRSAIEDYIIGSEEFVPADKATVVVRVEAFNGSSIDLLVYCFTQSSNYGDYTKVQEKLLLRIKEIVEQAGASFAFPSRSIYVENAAGAEPDHFAPGEEDDAASLPKTPARRNKPGADR